MSTLRASLPKSSAPSSNSWNQSFGTFIADLQANKCEIGMFALGATLQRAQAVEFSKPYMLASIYAVDPAARDARSGACGRPRRRDHGGLSHRAAGEAGI